MRIKNKHNASFRDPSGFVFTENSIVKRCILPIYFMQYQALKSSGFFNKLVQQQLLIPHEETLISEEKIVITPEQIPFITYPYEWSFMQYKTAALHTLKLQKYALEHGFSLKDASAFNVTFYKGKAIFIDTLSFDFYTEGTPWRAYKQFIMHFLGPLVLAKYHGAQSLKLMQTYLDGIPLKLLASLIPLSTKFNTTLYTNIHLLARAEKKYNSPYSEKNENQSIKLTKKAQLNLITHLFNFIKKLNLKEKTEWGDYYNFTNYEHEAIHSKSQIINTWVNNIKPNTLIDVGGNDGKFVRDLKHQPKLCLVGDIDNTAVDTNFKTVKENKESHILPFMLDVLNPSAGIGFENTERTSLIQRLKTLQPEVTFALALIHHMTLSGNIPFKRSAHFFALFSKYVIIEFPTRQDSYVKRLLNQKREFKTYFDFYNLENFEVAYTSYFKVLDKIEIEKSNRILFLLKLK